MAADNARSLVYVNSDEVLEEVLAELAAAPLYALDTEFHRERTYFPRLALLQVATRQAIYLIDPLAVSIAELAAVLKGPGLAIVHAADQDFEVLDQACGAVPSRYFDTQIAAGFLGHSSAALSTLVHQLLGHRLKKGDQLTDWTRRPLSDNQLEYAASDVAHLIELFEVETERLIALGRLEWANAEFELARSRSRGPIPPRQAWWRLRQVRQLHGKERAVAQEVAAWREVRARELDRPVRMILSDLAVISIAHRPPQNRIELAEVRTIEGRHLGGGAADELLAAVKEGLSLDPSEVLTPPGPDTDSPPRAAVTLVAAWVGERARELGIDTAILATRADLIAYLKDPPEGRLAQSWRHELIGEPIRRLVEGRAALAMDNENLVLVDRTSH